MAKKTHTLSEAAGEPQGYEYPGVIAGRKIVFEELTVRAIRQFQAIGKSAREDKGIDSDAVIDLVFDMLTSSKVKVTEGEPFTRENVDELGVKDVIALQRFFVNPRQTLDELIAPAQEGEVEDDPKAETE